MRAVLSHHALDLMSDLQRETQNGERRVYRHRCDKRFYVFFHSYVFPRVRNDKTLSVNMQKSSNGDAPAMMVIDFDLSHKIYCNILLRRVTV